MAQSGASQMDLLVAASILGPYLIGLPIVRFFVNAHKRWLGILMGLVLILVLFLGIQWRLSADINDCYEKQRSGVAVGLCGELNVVWMLLFIIISSIQAVVFSIIALRMKPSNKQQITTN